ncbi:response regulator transcription factor [Listeria monocytogenes]|uniref:LytR/AlgR family response regulator transcription factor n=1 Tax=Listeria monocytogenes TaxID=1639 RepID=UPI0010EA4F39|nr:LytTR family DNA-binding domain-containing protein [Listeria monocytogenes]EAD7632605.1 response regulator transcription factor [Listeria monocytogenes]
MLKIFVCEDDEQQRENIVAVIKNYLYMQDYDVIFGFDTNDPLELLAHLSKEEDGVTGLYFLDVDLNTDMNGISLGAEIRKVDPSAKIVFVTTHAELAYLTFLYKIEAMEYIPKDNRAQLQEKVTECIDVAVERYLNVKTGSKEHIVIKSGNSQIKLDVADVQFIESSSTPHRLIVHLDNRQIEFYGKIKEMEELNPHFYRCHQSYVVNTMNIDVVYSKQREIQMKDGELCYASVRYLKGLLSKLEMLKK